MAQIVLTSAQVSIENMTIGTNAVKSVTINDTPEILDNTGMGHTAKSRKIGIDDWAIDIEILQDYADNQLDENLWSIRSSSGHTGTIAIRPTTAVRSGDNPEYGATNGFLESYSPIAADTVGALGVAKLRILSIGAILTRTTTST